MTVRIVINGGCEWCTAATSEASFHNLLVTTMTMFILWWNGVSWRCHGSTRIDDRWSNGRRSVVRSLIRDRCLASASASTSLHWGEETRRTRRASTAYLVDWQDDENWSRSGVRTDILPPHYWTKPSACRHDFLLWDAARSAVRPSSGVDDLRLNE